MLGLALVIALVTLPAHQARGAGTTPRLDWGVKTPMPTARRELALAAAPNGKLYAVGGLNVSDALATVEEYDPATNGWTTKAPMPTARKGLGLAAAPNGKLYAVGGSGATGILATVEEYDPATNSWTAKAPMPTARAYFGLAMASNGTLYAAGGNNDTDNLATVEEYDPVRNSWTTRAGLHDPRRGLAVAAALNGKLYAVGGLGVGPGYSTMLEEYDPAADIWTVKAPMPTARVYFGLAAVSSGKLYAVGGYNGSSLDVVEEYDPSIDHWLTRTHMPTGRDLLAVAVAPANGKLYAVGGESPAALSRAIEEYDPQANTWSGVRAAPLPSARSAPATAVADGKLYAFGGQQSGTPLDEVLQYDTAASRWTAMTSMPTPRYGAGAVTAANGKIYVVGGNSLAGFCPAIACATVEEYTPPNGFGGGSWRTVGNGIRQLPAVRSFAGLALGQNGKVYLSGGIDGSVARAETYEYDPGTNSAWQRMADMRQARTGHGLVRAGDGKVYAVGGILSGVALTTVERFIAPTTAAPQGSWEGGGSVASLPAARGLLGLVSLPNGRLVAAGGTDSGSGTTAYPDVYEYDVLANNWTPLPPLPAARYEPGMALLGTRQLLVIGGRAGGADLSTVEEGDRDELPTINVGGPYTVLAGNTVPLTASANDPEGDLLNVAWDLDGTLFYTTPGQNVDFRTVGFAPGRRTVRARAIDPLGGYAVASTTLTIIAPARVAFATQPGIAPAGARLSPQPVVRVEAADGTLISDFNGPVTLAFGTNAGGGILGGTPTVNAVNGVATFTDLFVTAPGSGYTLVASSGSLQTAASAPFTVTPAPSLCSPRPNVAVATTRAGAGRLQATLTAQSLPATPNNSLQRIVVTRMDNATASLNGSPVTAGVSVPFQAGTTQATLLLQRQNPAASATVAFTVADGCGDWKSFVGGGPGAF